MGVGTIETENHTAQNEEENEDGVMSNRMVERNATYDACVATTTQTTKKRTKDALMIPTRSVPARIYGLTTTGNIWGTNARAGNMGYCNGKDRKTGKVGATHEQMNG